MPKKYRYMMYGTFPSGIPIHKTKIITNDPVGIVIPAPVISNSKKEALKQYHWSYRFGYKNGEVVILIYPEAKFDIHQDITGEIYMKTWAKGYPYAWYDYNTFIKNGGFIYELPEESAVFLPVRGVDPSEATSLLEKHAEKYRKTDWNIKDAVINTVTFDQLFPFMNEHSRKIYIDNESYSIEEI